MNEELEVIYMGRTIVIRHKGDVVAAGSPKAVCDTLKERFASVLKGRAANSEPEPARGGGL